MAPVVGSAVVQAELRGTGEWLLRAKEQPNRYCNGVLKAALLSGVLSSVGVTRLLGGIKGKGCVAQSISGGVRFGNRWLE